MPVTAHALHLAGRDPNQSPTAPRRQAGKIARQKFHSHPHTTVKTLWGPHTVQKFTKASFAGSMVVSARRKRGTIIPKRYACYYSVVSDGKHGLSCITVDAKTSVHIEAYHATTTSKMGHAGSCRMPSFHAKTSLNIANTIIQESFCSPIYPKRATIPKA